MKKLLIFLAFFTLNADELCKELYLKYLGEYKFLANYKDFCAGVNEIYLSLSKNKKIMLNELYFNNCKDKNSKYCKYIKTLYENSQLKDKSLYYKALELDCNDRYSCFDILHAMKNESNEDKKYFYKFLEEKCKNEYHKNDDFCYAFVQYKYITNDDLMCRQYPSTCFALANKENNKYKKALLLKRACDNKNNEACILIKDYKSACDNKYAPACDELAKIAKKNKDYKALKIYMKLSCEYGGECNSYDFSVENFVNEYKKKCSEENLQSCQYYVSMVSDIDKDFYVKFSKIYKDLCHNDNIYFCQDAVKLEYKMKKYDNVKDLIDFACSKDTILCQKLSLKYLKNIYEESF